MERAVINIHSSDALHSKAVRPSSDLDLTYAAPAPDVQAALTFDTLLSIMDFILEKTAGLNFVPDSLPLDKPDELPKVPFYCVACPSKNCIEKTTRTMTASTSTAILRFTQHVLEATRV